MPRINSGGWKSGDLKIHSGTLDDIPSGWELASEMIDRAIVGAGGVYAKGQKFGTDSVTPAKPSVSVSVANHTLSTARVPSHNHHEGFAADTTSGAKYGTTNVGSYMPSRTTGNTKTNSTNTSSSGSSGAHNHGTSVSVGNVGAVDTRQKSIAVIWIRKL